MEKAKTDMLCDGLRDIGVHAMAFFRESDEAQKVWSIITFLLVPKLDLVKKCEKIGFCILGK